MIYPFMTLEDDTEITHTEMLPDGRVKVYVETPDAKDCFHSMVCYLPEYKVENIEGYSEAEVNKYLDTLKKEVKLYFKKIINNNDLIME